MFRQVHVQELSDHSLREDTVLATVPHIPRSGVAKQPICFRFHTNSARSSYEALYMERFFVETVKLVLLRNLQLKGLPVGERG
jgi:hypothetical protein